MRGLIGSRRYYSIVNVQCWRPETRPGSSLIDMSPSDGSRQGQGFGGEWERRRGEEEEKEGRILKEKILS